MLSFIAPLLVTLPLNGAISVQDPADLFPAPSGSLHVMAADQEGSSLYELVKQYGELTGLTFHVGAETRQFLEHASTGLTAAIEVKPDKVQTYFERILIENHFCLQVFNTSTPTLLSIESLQTGARTSLRANTLLLTADQISLAAQHPAMLVTTVVHLPNTDVRQLSKLDAHDAHRRQHAVHAARW